MTVGRRIHKIDAIPTVRTQPKLRVAFYCRTSTVLEVVINYLLGNQEVVEDIIKSFSENNNQKPNEREKPKQKIQKKEDAEKQEQELKREKRRKNEKTYEC